MLAVCAAALTGCGGGGSSPSADYHPPKANRAAPAANLFPNASAKTLRQVLESTDGPAKKSALFLESPAEVFYKGPNRYPIQITTKAGTPIDRVDVALYLAKVQVPRPKNGRAGKASAAQAQSQALASPAEGPYPARMETLATEPQFTARSTVEDPSSATAVYVDSLDFPTNGEWKVAAVVKEGNETFSATLPNVSVGEFRRVPKVGQRPPLIHTPTAASVGGDLEAISSRQPPTTMNEMGFASVLGRTPILLVFASPKFSWNHTAGPTVDVAEQVRRQFTGRVAFINTEAYSETRSGNVVPRPQVRAYHLPTEPWLFAIDRHGQVVGEIEGATGVTELTRLVQRALAN